jgi:hypothetical protein
MAIKDNKSNTNPILAVRDTIAADGVSYTYGVDTADYDNGITYVPTIATPLTATTTVTITNIQDSPNDTDWTNVPSNQIIGDLSTALYASTSLPSLGEIISSFGLIGTNRYVRLELTTTNYDVDVVFIAFLNAGIEVAPGDQGKPN